MSKLYVGNLPYSVTDNELAAIFTEFGPVVTSVIIREGDSGRSKGFGFIELESEEKAAAAVVALNETEVGGRTIVVNPAKPREE